MVVFEGMFDFEGVVVFVCFLDLFLDDMVVLLEELVDGLWIVVEW